MNRSVWPVVLCGGSGTRLWPLSRALHPKQFIALTGEHTLLQDTVRRLGGIEGLEAPVVVCNEAHRFMAAEQLRAAGAEPAAIVLEPTERNTAPAIAAAALEVLARRRADDEADPVLLVLPADHVIRDGGRLAGALREAIREAAAGRLATFGVVPTRPETGYGYIEAAPPPPAGEDGAARAVARFVEKPDAATAAAFIEAGDHYWNSGIFAFGAGRYLDELGAHAAPVRGAVEEAHRKAVRDLDFLRLDAAAFARSPAVSIDRAVMERTSDAVMVPLAADWTDVGSWGALAALAERDEAGNAAEGDVLLTDVRNTYVRAQGRMVAAAGVENLVIVETADAVLVADKGSDQAVRAIVERLRGADREEYRSARKVYRPWGFFDSVHERDGFKVKHIVVHPGQRLSLQMHHHRAEHWVVVHGAARVTRGGERFTLSEGESTYIPRGVRHRLENPGPAPLEIVEVQSGPYLGEDDIVRFEDAYGRSGGGDAEEQRTGEERTGAARAGGQRGGERVRSRG